MGFDLTGVKPRTEVGSYFRNNVWYWRPLWKYIHQLKLIDNNDYERGSYNDGYLIAEDKAKRIGDTLDKLIKEGEVAREAINYKDAMEKEPDVTCLLCKGTGTRCDAVTGNKPAACNACAGKGEREAWCRSYPFHVSNVKEFSEFCKTSGGFEIW